MTKLNRKTKPDENEIFFAGPVKGEVPGSFDEMLEDVGFSERRDYDGSPVDRAYWVRLCKMSGRKVMTISKDRTDRLWYWEGQRLGDLEAAERFVREALPKAATLAIFEEMTPRGYVFKGLQNGEPHYARGEDNAHVSWQELIALAENVAHKRKRFEHLLPSREVLLSFAYAYRT